MHYSPSVAEAFNSVEHGKIAYCIIFTIYILSLFVYFSLYILIVDHLSLAKTFNINPLRAATSYAGGRL